MREREQEERIRREREGERERKRVEEERERERTYRDTGTLLFPCNYGRCIEIATVMITGDDYSSGALEKIVLDHQVCISLVHARAEKAESEPADLSWS